MRRRIIPPRVLAAERDAITQFLFDRAVPADGAVKLPLSEVFGGYEKWRGANGLGKSLLTLDGFGRMFPQTYVRGASYYKPLGQTVKCVFGLGLREIS